MSHLLIRGDARRIPLRDGSVHCVVTSPPYYGLRDYGMDGQIGLEPTPDAYVSSMVGVFREVRRVLRDDGICWINIGDSYAGSNMTGGTASKEGSAKRSGRMFDRAGAGKVAGRMANRDGNPCPPGLKPKDLIGIPWMLAFALRADGWWLRSECIWHKPNPMPESIRDRPTKSHEQVFLLTKGDRYFYDRVAIVEPSSPNTHPRGNGIGKKNATIPHGGLIAYNESYSKAIVDHVADRNCRSVWTITTNPFKGAHFATMPVKLAERCIKAGTSRKGCCPRCGAPWVRRVKRVRVATRPGNDSKVNRASQYDVSPYNGHSGMVVGNRDPRRHTTEIKTVGWESSCTCLEPRPVPCVVFDPFGGAATTVVVAEALGRRGVCTELSEKYLGIARRRVERPHARTDVERPRPDDDMPLFGALQ